MQTAPIRVIRIAMTIATIGRRMKNLDMIGCLTTRRRGGRRRWGPRLRVHHRAFPRFLDAFDNDLVTGLESFLDDPIVVDPPAHFDGLDMHLVVRPHDRDLVSSL